jgi:hypothetical protein
MIIIDKKLSTRLLVTKKVQQAIASRKYPDPDPIPNKYSDIISNLFDDLDFAEIILL